MIFDLFRLAREHLPADVAANACLASNSHSFFIRLADGIKRDRREAERWKSDLIDALWEIRGHSPYQCELGCEAFLRDLCAFLEGVTITDADAGADA